MIKVNISEGLIGDFLGSIPAVQALAKTNDVVCTYLPEVEELFDMTGLCKWKEEDDDKIVCTINLNCTDAWNIAIKKDLHMTQAYFECVGLPIPEAPVRADLSNPLDDVFGSPGFIHGKYIIAPFSRSLPDNQKLHYSVWDKLVSMSDKMFYVIGGRLDQKGFVRGDNVQELYGLPLCVIMYMIKRMPLISVISGPSHLSFHLGGINYLFDNQSCSMRWGVNPDAIKITDPIPTITAERIMEYL